MDGTDYGESIDLEEVRRLLTGLEIRDKEAAGGACGPVSESIVERLHAADFRTARTVRGTVEPGTCPGEWATLTRKTWTENGKTFVQHIWVELDGYIIDGTAAQFGESPLLIVNRSR